MDTLFKHLANLDPKQRQLLTALLQEQGVDIARRFILPRPRDGADVPLAFAQQRLWFLDQLEPGNPAYNIPATVRLEGQLDIVVLEQCLDAIRRRHEILRTTFVVMDGRPFQRVAPAEPDGSRNVRGLPIMDLRAVPEAGREAYALQLAAEALRQCFDLTRGPLVQTLLLRLGATDHILLVTMHHIVADGWSIGLLIRELAALYESYAAARPTRLPDLPIQYADFALWQREWLQEEILAPQLAYWKQRLGGNLPWLELPTDHPRPPIQTFNGAVRSFVIARNLTPALVALSQHEGATLFMTLLAALQVLLYRYTGQPDITVGTPIAGRTRAETEDLIGCFVNTLIMRTDLAGDPTFRELLRRVCEVCLQAYAHQDLPFERLVEALQPQRSLGYATLFQVAFVLYNTPMPALELPGLILTPLAVSNGTTLSDLMLAMEETEHGLVGTLTYNTDLFDPPSSARIADHFQTLLGGIAANPDQPLSALPLLTEAERHQILREWNNVHDNPPDACVHQLFEAQVERTPDGIAVVFDFRDKETGRQGDKETTGRTTNDDSVFSLQPPRGYPAFSLQLTYAELNARANQLAHELRTMASAPGQPIPIMLMSGPRQVIALLAILKAGCAFVCLSPDFPQARLQHMLDEVDPPCLISDSASFDLQRELCRQFQQKRDRKVLLLDSTGDRAERADPHDTASHIQTYPATNPHISVSPTDLVYIAYTSGSTGKPKGVMHLHRNFRQFLWWYQRHFQLQPGKRVGQWAAITFDPSYADVFGTICSGATLCMTTELIKADPAAVVEWMWAKQITLLQIVPSFFKQMLRIVDAIGQTAQPPFPDLEQLVFVGEALPVELVSTLIQRFARKLRLFNLYGPTESVVATCCTVEAISRDQRSIPVGRPIDGRRILIVDQGQQLCPIGVKGEIFIQSDYLMSGYFRQQESGYFRQQEWTQTVMPSAPVSNAAPERVYRTGDIGRWLPDGTIEFCGRIDHQVKIRGNRVELEEIEAILSLHKAIIECAAAVHSYGADDQRLVAYVIVGGNPTRHELREFMAAQLPAYMIPSIFIFLSELPHTPSGKVDRKVLPKPEQQQVDDSREYVAPRTALEQTVVALWKELLRIDMIGIYDNFFDLGGHSVLLAQMINKLKQDLHIELSLRDFLAAPNVAALSNTIDVKRRSMSSDIEKIALIMEQVKNTPDAELRITIDQRKPKP